MKAHNGNIVGWLMVFLYVLLNSYGALIIKFKVSQLGKVDTSHLKAAFSYFLLLFSSPLVISGLCSIFLSALAWMTALSRMEISLAYPVAVGANFLIVVCLGLILYGETISINKGIGIALIFLSIFILSRS